MSSADNSFNLDGQQHVPTCAPEPSTTTSTTTDPGNCEPDVSNFQDVLSRSSSNSSFALIDGPQHELQVARDKLLQNAGRFNDERATLNAQLEGKDEEIRMLKLQLASEQERIGMMRDSISLNAEMVSNIVKLEIEKARLGWEQTTLEPELAKILKLNHWNRADCHPDLFIDDSLLVVERRKQTEEEFFTIDIRAKMMMPRRHGIFYFEVKIFGRGTHKSWLSVGLAPAKSNVIYSYTSDGVFWGHHVDGCAFYDDKKELPYLKGKPSYEVDDVIGCGVNLATRQIIYTKNGQRLDTANLFVSNTVDLYPCIGLDKIGDKMEANFGQREFVYVLAKELIDQGNGNGFAKIDNRILGK